MRATIRVSSLLGALTSSEERGNHYQNEYWLNRKLSRIGVKEEQLSASTSELVKWWQQSRENSDNHHDNYQQKVCDKTNSTRCVACRYVIHQEACQAECVCVSPSTLVSLLAACRPLSTWYFHLFLLLCLKVSLSLFLSHRKLCAQVMRDTADWIVDTLTLICCCCC